LTGSRRVGHVIADANCNAAQRYVIVAPDAGLTAQIRAHREAGDRVEGA
jgi:hypothetical protein